MKLIRIVLLASLIVMSLVVTQQAQAYAQDGWTTLLKIAKNFTDSCTAAGHTDAECKEMFSNLGKK
jgi:hypothetical protein